MIGLKRGTVEIVDYCDEWPRAYEIEKEEILSVIGSSLIRIEHVGSTSIPQMKAKPLIDIAVEVGASEEIERFAPILEKKGYTYFGDREGHGDYFFAKGPDEKRTHYLHVSIRDSLQFDRYLIFRDILRQEPVLAKEYQELKEELCNAHASDRKQYTKKKNDFIHTVINRNSNQSVEDKDLGCA